MQRSHPKTRSGFTLVELLMVIIIIGILAGMLIVAVGPAIGTANNAVVKTEINQLDIAMNNYRDTYGALPPTMVTSNVSSPGSGNSTIQFLYNENDKKRRFQRHAQKAFPRFRGTYLEGGGDAVGGTDGTLSSGTIFVGSGVYSTITRCWLDHMDAAEALVFWLGGIPKIWTANDEEYEVELTGFSRDPNNPFLPEYDPNPGTGTVGVDYQPNRTTPLFEFDPRRLVDSDKDGWPEYVPDMGGTADETPPYAYFDASTYGVLPFYPSMNHPRLSDWGVARPYLIRYTRDGNQLPLPASFAAAETFQIICAGADNQFGTSDPALAVEAVVHQLPVYTEGKYYDLVGDPYDAMAPNAIDTPGSIDAEQFDNLTNFSESKLENEFESN